MSETRIEADKEKCGCHKIVPVLLDLRIPILPLGKQREMGWYCECGKAFLSLDDATAKLKSQIAFVLSGI